MFHTIYWLNPNFKVKEQCWNSVSCPVKASFHHTEHVYAYFGQRAQRALTAHTHTYSKQPVEMNTLFYQTCTEIHMYTGLSRGEKLLEGNRNLQWPHTGVHIESIAQCKPAASGYTATQLHQTIQVKVIATACGINRILLKTSLVVFVMYY